MEASRTRGRRTGVHSRASPSGSTAHARYLPLHEALLARGVPHQVPALRGMRRGRPLRGDAHQLRPRPWIRRDAADRRGAAQRRGPSGSGPAFGVGDDAAVWEGRALTVVSEAVADPDLGASFGRGLAALGFIGTGAESTAAGGSVGGGSAGATPEVWGVPKRLAGMTATGGGTAELAVTVGLGASGRRAATATAVTTTIAAVNPAAPRRVHRFRPGQGAGRVGAGVGCTKAP